MFGGIDLGGTKIEACLFSVDLEPITSRRIATPRSSYPELIDAIAAQYDWLRTAAAVRDLPLGVGVPGIVERPTGLSKAVNLVAYGKPLHDDLSRRLNFPVPVENDCRCFALSEANGGAGQTYETVFGLILGTGCGGGVCYKGKLVAGTNGVAGEVGHIALPMNAAPPVQLPLLRCACGRFGCYETLAAGPGMTALARELIGVEVDPEKIAAEAAAGNQGLQHVFDAWLDIVCELLRTIQLNTDPGCIVLGGGLSRIEGVAELLKDRFTSHSIEGVCGPAILAARYGDSSGVRGAAMLAAPKWNRDR